jgi:hypothetical protein
VNLNFTSRFSFYNKFLDYSEDTDVQVKLDKINAVTVFLKLEVDKDTKKLNVNLEKVSMKPEF